MGVRRLGASQRRLEGEIAIKFAITSASSQATEVTKLKNNIKEAATEGSIVANVQKAAFHNNVLTASLKAQKRAFTTTTTETTKTVKVYVQVRPTPAQPTSPPSPTPAPTTPAPTTAAPATPAPTTPAPTPENLNAASMPAVSATLVLTCLTLGMM